MKLSRKGRLRSAKYLMGFGAVVLNFQVLAFDLNVDAVELPKSMGSIGDSMTAGALADFKRQEFGLPWEEARLLIKLIQFGASKDVEKVEARHLSWSGGYDTKQRVYSHSYRLSAIARLDHQMPTANVAVSGNESKDIWDQAGRLNIWAEENFNQAYPDYVTLMIGPNDICADTADEMVSTIDYHANIAKVVDEVLARSPQSRILINSLPNIEKLRMVAYDKRLYIGLTCEKLWKKIKLCPTLTTESDPNERAKIAQRVIDYNDALQDIVDSRTPSYGDRVRLSRAAYAVDFTENDLSVDCFHPNPFGQEKLATVSFADSWWADDWAAVKAQLEADKEANQKKKCESRARGGNHRTRTPTCN